MSKTFVMSLQTCEVCCSYFGTCPKGKYSATQLHRYLMVMPYMQWVCSKEQKKATTPVFQG